MKIVFISGSRSIKFLNEEVVIWLDNLPLDTEILIGDASDCSSFKEICKRFKFVRKFGN